MRVAPKTGNKGLNSDSSQVPIESIEQRVNEFRTEIVSDKEYSRNKLHQKMIEQIDKYWEKLFADPIQVETANGTVFIQPQRTNNYSERGFRDFKRGYRKKTGNNSLGNKLRTMIADTPLVKNLKNPEYMRLLLNGHSSLEALFAEIDVGEVRRLVANSQGNIDRVPAKLRKLIKMPDFPVKLKAYYLNLKSNGILCQ